ncbi:helix-turn-helix domain-containing protein [Halogeometricum limi]|uniref:GAF and HTH_10 associated domain-containing protein n=1 Tax=Halogeometricum limi TaxID=555875 RepID=A0A1I6IJ71_9EURY|nr:helix-turn-helix domain-containing protein [Halogeometricum limi]SFR66738.1 GAF and HTH_10 associated domain-containing protein [Halogeometricum limi]
MSQRGGSVARLPFEEVVKDVESYAVLTLTADGLITSWNDGCARLFLRSHEEAVGHPFETLVQQWGSDCIALSSLLARAEKAGRSEGEQWCRRSDGAVCKLHVVVETVDEGGFLVVVADTTLGPATHAPWDNEGELAVLDSIHRVTRELVREVTTASGGEHTESTLCDLLVELPFYTEAWVGEWDETQGALVPRTGSVDERNYHLVATVNPASLGLTTGTTFVAHPASEDEFGEESTRESVVESTVVVPMADGETVTEALVVHARRRDPVGEHERMALAALAETVAFVKHARWHDPRPRDQTSVEFEFVSERPSTPFGVVAAQCECDCWVDDIVSTTDGTAVQFFSVRGESPSRVARLLDGMPDVEAYRFVDRGVVLRVMGRIGRADFLTKLVDAGGAVQSASADSGLSQVVVRTTASNAARIAGLVQRDYPEWEMTRKWTVARTAGAPTYATASLENRLTEKQLTALRMAYLMGYYDHPRKATAEEVAAALGISGSTLHQHLQVAVRKLLETSLRQTGVQ